MIDKHIKYIYTRPDVIYHMYIHMCGHGCGYTVHGIEGETGLAHPLYMIGPGDPPKGVTLMHAMRFRQLHHAMQ